MQDKKGYEEIIREVVAKWISKEASSASLITVTGVSYEKKGNKCFVHITVMPEEKEKAVLDFLKRNVVELRKHVGSVVKNHKVPFIEVHLDAGEKNRYRIIELLEQDKD
ncbi:MAG: ribosome-binding factor A [Candidatus Nomurabacteria bacterium]|nr:MAG: ribosome-binding factor A [Candidatus Nomurabacteria bacterium]